ncbi:MAG: class I SAM-dependent methyltransferase [Chthoniobacterales bacterium]|nr:class I SAM-dependent methyltransferase [Chthoniobacterales bacterium]
MRFIESKRERKNQIWNILCKDFFQKFIRTSDVVVDVACGYGEFLNHILASKKIGIDLNLDSKKYLNSDIIFCQCEATQLGNFITAEADIIFISNFLEHLPDKKTLNIFLDEIMKGLKPGGRVLILGPNLRYLAGQYWDFYDHHLGLTHLSLSEVLIFKGFKIELCQSRFLPYTVYGALPTHPLLVWLYLKVPLAWKILGKQFFLVAQKPLRAD